MPADKTDCLTAWMDAWSDQLLRTCVYLLGDYALAEDAVQETFLKAWQKMDQFEGRNQASEKTWLMHIAVNTCRSMQRSGWFRHHDRRVVPEELVLPAEDQDRSLLMSVQELPPKLRQVVVLRYFAGCTLEEMAAITGHPRSTLHSRLKKAMKQLQVELKEVDDDEAK